MPNDDDDDDDAAYCCFDEILAQHCYGSMS